VSRTENLPRAGLEAVARMAAEAAGAGAEVLRSRRHAFGEVRAKSSAVDVVTDADIASGVAVVRSILGAQPSARFIVEEDEVFGLTDAAKADDAFDGEVWMIDPLDGTTSFFHDYPCFSVSVALLVDGVPAVGVVHDAALDTVYAATRGSGATQDGAPLRCSDAATLSRALLVSGFPYDRGEPLRRQLPILAAMMAEAHDMRRDGSAAIDCCHVAAGRCDGYWELAMKPWDLAAGVLIAAEAGAIVTDFDGQPWTPDATTIVTANPRLHPILLDKIAAAGGRA